MIIPDETVKAILDTAKRMKATEFSIAPNVITITAYSESQIINFKPVYGTFPDIARVMPDGTPGAVGVIGFDGDKMGIMGKVYKAFTGRKTAELKVTMKDASSPMLIGPVVNEGDTLTCVLMPTRMK